MDRVFLIPGLFYGMEGMRIGGIRELRISPHMAYGEEGVEGSIPPNAVLRAQVTVLAEVDPAARPRCSLKRLHTDRP
jgi:FKBP-type peptidyl-prolyl cis-trans isomerase